jgi:hypothetical protein
MGKSAMSRAASQKRAGPDFLSRLVKLLGMCGSAFDGERANAARLADQLVRQSGLTWNDVISGLPASVMPNTSADEDWHELHMFCLTRAGCLRGREREFLDSLKSWRGELTPKQRDWLMAIYERLQRNAA